MNQLVNKNNNSIIARNVEFADNFFKRLLGLMFRKNFQEGRAIIIKPCNMIHTFFMRFPIDALFVSKDNEIIHIIENMQPGKTSKLIRKASMVIELPAGTVEKTQTKKEEKILIIKNR